MVVLTSTCKLMTRKPSISSTTFLLSPPAACIALQNNHILIGTYTLDEATATRSGSLILTKPVMIANGGVELQNVQTIILPEHLGAVLDIRLAPGSHRDQNGECHSLIAVATSTGHILFYKTIAIHYDHGSQDEKDQNIDVKIIQHSIHPVFDKSILVLSIMFHPVVQGVVVCTLSSGEIVVLRIDEALPKVEPEVGTKATFEHKEELVVEKEVKTIIVAAELDRHENVHTGLEVWTSGFNETGDLLFTGGDDGAFCRFAVGVNSGDTSDDDDGECVDKSSDEGEERQSENVGDKKYKLTLESRDRKTHTAGVTAILSVRLPRSNTEVILTGSYDCNLRVYNATSRKFIDVELNLDGGVWRLERLNGGKSGDGNEQQKLLILASCMHAGCRIVEVVEDENGVVGMNVVGRMEEHESMNYASAAIGDREGEDSWTVVSTSFYDKRVCVWRYANV